MKFKKSRTILRVGMKTNHQSHAFRVRTRSAALRQRSFPDALYAAFRNCVEINASTIPTQFSKPRMTLSTLKLALYCEFLLTFEKSRSRNDNKLQDDKAYQREFKAFEDLDNLSKKVLIITDELDYSTGTVSHISLKDFLVAQVLEDFR